jgi:hypothetical protein
MSTGPADEALAAMPPDLADCYRSLYRFLAEGPDTEGYWTGMFLVGMPNHWNRRDARWRDRAAYELRRSAAVLRDGSSRALNDGLRDRSCFVREVAALAALRQGPAAAGAIPGLVEAIRASELRDRYVGKRAAMLAEKALARMGAGATGAAAEPALLAAAEPALLALVEESPGLESCVLPVLRAIGPEAEAAGRRARDAGIRRDRANDRRDRANAKPGIIVHPPIPLD